MKRRTLLATGAVSLAAPPAWAQPATGMRRIGVLSAGASTVAAVWQAELKRGLAELGWVEGRAIEIVFRYAEGDNDRLPGLVAGLLDLKVDLIVTEATSAAIVANQATKTVPIVMASVGDPVVLGLAASLARPGGNATGLSQNLVEPSGKRLEKLREVVPDLTDVAVLWRPADGNSRQIWEEVQRSSVRLGLRLHSIEVDGLEALNRALAAPVDALVRGLYVVPTPLVTTHMKPIAEFAARRRLASIYHVSEYVRLGGLMSYGPDRGDQYRRAASYVDRILKGAKPADLPIEQPVKYEFVVNQKTARALGLTFAPSLLAQADEVIE